MTLLDEIVAYVVNHEKLNVVVFDSFVNFYVNKSEYMNKLKSLSELDLIINLKYCHKT